MKLRISPAPNHGRTLSALFRSLQAFSTHQTLMHTCPPMPRRISSLALLLAALAVSLTSAPRARAYETDVQARDPSTVVHKDGTYWVYGTGVGVGQFSSPDRVHWKFRGPVFPAAPAWVASAVPGNKNNIAWAPDIRKFGGTYFLYYCYSTIGSKVSGIGVATSTTLDPKSWTDRGVVVRTGAGTDFNALDPCIFEDAEGRPWLSFGSYFSGIKLAQIDPQTGKRAANGPLYAIATRPDMPGNAIEASAVTYRGGYYYLFVDWGSSVAGARSTYNIRMGRSRAVTGPYLDKQGKGMAQGGGTLFLGAVFDNGSGRPPDDEVGPGHFGRLTDADGDWVSTHYEWARDKGGATTVNINRLAWDSDGWPRAVLDPGPYKVVSALATHDLLSVKGEVAPAAALQTWYDAGLPGQRWTLAYRGDGDYTLLVEGPTGGGLALTVADGPARPGAKVILAPDTGRAGQRWHVQQGDDGTYMLFPRSGAGAVALDISGNSPNDGAAMEQWTANGVDCQRWSFRVR
jgi:arabinan endo-1,5-alpha-L-arabinosidase